MDFLYIITEVSKLSSILLFFFGIIYYKKLNKPFKWLVCFFGLFVFFEYFNTEFRKIYGTNTPLLHLFTPIEFSIFFIVFGQYFRLNFFKNLIIITAFWGLAFLDAFYINNLYTHNTVARPTESIILMIASYYNLLKQGGFVLDSDSGQSKLSSGDLGTAAVMIVFVLALAFLIGVPWNFLGVFIGMGTLAFYIASIISPNRMRRILAFFDRASIPADETNWQITHGTWALASGGLFGTGLGDSKMKWGWIPAVENDFIFSVIGEEVGFIGAVIVIILFFMLARYIRQVSINSATDFGSVAVTGIMLWLTLQAFINIAVVLDLFPVIGVPLPLFSRGGSSMLAVLMALGVVLAVERDRAIPKRGVRKK
jgi:hypothetical protein